METQIACSLVEAGIKCGEAQFIPASQYQMALMFAIIGGMIVGIIYVFLMWVLSERDFKRKMRDLGYEHILGELYGASEKWIPRE
jgi:hypothetical protein